MCFSQCGLGALPPPKKKHDFIGIFPKCQTPLSKETILKLLGWFAFIIFQILNQDWVMKLIRYHLPTIVKHVLVPKNDLGIPKITFGNWEDPIPPLPFGKNSQKIPFFLLGGVPNLQFYKLKLTGDGVSAAERHRLVHVDVIVPDQDSSFERWWICSGYLWLTFWVELYLKDGESALD